MTADSAHVRAVAIDLLREHLAQAGHLRFDVIGACMSPLIEIGDQVELHAVSVARLHVGDILLFDDSGQFYTHRLLAPPRHQANQWLLQTRGDRSPWRDRPWEASQLVGQVVAVYKPDGRRIDLMHGYWPALNRVLGTASRWEAALLVRGMAVRRRLFGTRTTPVAPWAHAVLTAPGRLLAYLLARFR